MTLVPGPHSSQRVIKAALNCWRWIFNRFVKHKSEHFKLAKKWWQFDMNIIRHPITGIIKDEDDVSSAECNRMNRLQSGMLWPMVCPDRLGPKRSQLECSSSYRSVRSNMKFDENWARWLTSFRCRIWRTVASARWRNRLLTDRNSTKHDTRTADLPDWSNPDLLVYFGSQKVSFQFLSNRLQLACCSFKMAQRCHIFAASWSQLDSTPEIIFKVDGQGSSVLLLTVSSSCPTDKGRIYWFCAEAVSLLQRPSCLVIEPSMAGHQVKTVEKNQKQVRNETVGGAAGGRHRNR
jgi:hypothetical protein